MRYCSKAILYCSKSLKGDALGFGVEVGVGVSWAKAEGAPTTSRFKPRRRAAERLSFMAT